MVFLVRWPVSAYVGLALTSKQFFMSDVQISHMRSQQLSMACMTSVPPLTLDLAVPHLKLPLCSAWTACKWGARLLRCYPISLGVLCCVVMPHLSFQVSQLPVLSLLLFCVLPSFLPFHHARLLQCSKRCLIFLKLQMADADIFTINVPDIWKASFLHWLLSLIGFFSLWPINL